MKAVIVTIGDELLIGQVVDTNSVFMAQQLEKIGCKIVEKVAISDTKRAILETLSRYHNNADLVLMTGGLGPTKDDVTKKTLVEYFKDTLVRNEEIYTHVKQLIEGFYQRPITEINAQQADVPSKATVLFNKVGTAPGMLLVKDRTTFISLPGVPFEMKALITEQVVPYVKQHFLLENIYHHTVVTAGVGESLLAELITDWENNLALKNISLAYLPHLGLVRLRLSKIDQQNVDVVTEVQNEVEKLKKIIPEYIISEDESVLLIDVVADQLLSNKATIALAESCTGGLFTQKFAEREGASQYLKGGAVTYASHAKVALLGVSQKTIDTYSVVSEQVAKEMALGAQRIYNSTYAIATTGNAGPTKGDSDKKVGTVCIGIATPHGVYAETFQLGQPRHKVIELTIQKGLLLIHKELKKSK